VAVSVLVTVSAVNEVGC